jgi:hypothetical protein
MVYGVIDVNRQPTSLPPFGIADIRKAIPAHCFKRSYLISFTYLIVDLIIVAALFAITPYIDPLFSVERMKLISAEQKEASEVHWMGCMDGWIVTMYVLVKT